MESEGEWLPFAYQPLENTPSITKEDINKVCFIGNPDDLRMKMIQYLGQKGLSIDVYGNHWEQYATQFKGYDISIHPPVFHEAFAETVLKYRLQLNIFRPHNIGSHNMRTFEVPAVGGIMLAPYSEEHVLLFEEDQEAFYYRNQEEAFEKAREIIALSAEKALEIKRRAKERSLQSHYTYRDRAKQVLAAFQNVLKV
jgi:spore maturation protein CgeB